MNNTLLKTQATLLAEDLIFLYGSTYNVLKFSNIGHDKMKYDDTIYYHAIKLVRKWNSDFENERDND